MSISSSPSPRSIPSALLIPSLSKFLRPSNCFRELRKHKHPLFPNSDQVVSTDKRIMLRISEQFNEESELTAKARELEILADLSSYSVFLAFLGFTAKQIDHGYEVNTLLEYGGNSLDTDIKKRQNQENPIVTEEQLWDLLFQVAQGLLILEKKGLVRHGHIMPYSLRKINGQFKLLYNLYMPKCFDLASNKIQQYYRFYLSPEQLSILRNDSQDRHLSCKSDIYSLGILVLNLATLTDLHNLCYLKLPSTKAALDENNINDKLAYVSEYYSKPFFNILGEMLRQTQEQRIPAADLVNKIEKHLKVQNEKKQIYLAKLIKAHEISKLPGISYDLPADQSKLKQIIKQKEAEKLKQKHKHTISKKDSSVQKQKQIDYRGTFGKPPEEQPKLTFKVTTHLHMKPLQEIEDNEFDQPEVPTMYPPSKSGSAKHMSLNSEMKNSKKSPYSKSEQSFQNDNNKKSNSQHYKNNLSTLQTPKIDSFMSGKDQKQQILTKFIKQQKCQSPKNTKQKANPPKEQAKVPEININKDPQPLSHQSDPPTIKDPIKPAQSKQVFPKQLQIQEAKLIESPIKTQHLDEPSHSAQQFESSGSPSSQNSPSINKPQGSSPPRTLKKNKPPPSLSDLIKTFYNPGVYIKGNIYYGPVLNGRRNGMGLEVFPNNQYYYGLFQNDLFHGQGLYFWSNEEYFEGIFHQGSKISGLMIIRKRIYQGQFKNNKRHGKGIAYYEGESYDGDWKEGRKDGQGVLWYKQGDVFKGRWVKGRRSGPGILQCRQFSIIGDWYNDELNGFVEIRYKNGDIYKGQYRDSQKTGQGSYFYAKGARFEGIFDNDEMIKGLMIYADGSFYDGQIGHSAKRHGKGSYVYANGDKYYGDWYEGKKHGYGKFETYQEIYEGYWSEGLRDGKGTLTHNLTGKQFSVQYEKDVLKKKNIIQF